MATTAPPVDETMRMMAAFAGAFAQAFTESQEKRKKMRKRQRSKGQTGRSRKSPHRRYSSDESGSSSSEDNEVRGETSEDDKVESSSAGSSSDHKRQVKQKPSEVDEVEDLTKSVNSNAKKIRFAIDGLIKSHTKQKAQGFDFDSSDVHLSHPQPAAPKKLQKQSVSKVAKSAPQAPKSSNSHRTVFGPSGARSSGSDSSFTPTGSNTSLIPLQKPQSLRATKVKRDARGKFVRQADHFEESGSDDPTILPPTKKQSDTIVENAGSSQKRPYVIVPSYCPKPDEAPAIKVKNLKSMPKAPSKKPVFGQRASPVPSYSSSSGDEAAGLPDTTRTVQRTGGGIPEALFQAEERYQRELSSMYSYNMSPLNQKFGEHARELMSEVEGEGSGDGKLEFLKLRKRLMENALSAGLNEDAVEAISSEKMNHPDHVVRIAEEVGTLRSPGAEVEVDDIEIKQEDDSDCAGIAITEVSTTSSILADADEQKVRRMAEGIVCIPDSEEEGDDEDEDEEIAMPSESHQKESSEINDTNHEIGASSSPDHFPSGLISTIPVDERRPQEQHHIVLYGPLISETEKKSQQQNKTDRTQITTQGSKQGEITRQFYLATDEEIAVAEQECEDLVLENYAIEKPKKYKIWQEIHEWVKETNAENDSPYTSYLSHEWPEKPFIREYLRRRFATIPIVQGTDPNLSMKTLMSKNVKQAIEPPIPTRYIKDSFHYKDYSGNSLFVKINTGAEEVFESTSETPVRINEYIFSAMDRLEARGVTAPAPTNVDLRHPTNNFRIAKDYWTKRGKPCGVYHFACWRQKAHAHDPWAMAGPWNHSLSRDVVGKRSMDIGFRFRFLADMAPIQQIMSLWFETIDPETYAEYRSHLDKMCDDDTGMEAIRFANNQSFLGVASLRNVQVHNHKDKGDVRDGWVGMTCTGLFSGGELCLPDLNIQVRFLPGDIILFRSAILQHFIRATIGERSSIVFFSHSGPRDVTQNANYFTTAEQHVRATEAKLKVFGEKMRKEERIRAFEGLGLAPYPTEEEDLSERQVLKARLRKRRFVKHAKEGVERGEVTVEELERVEGTPAARFHELNLIELGRHAKGEYPFAPVGVGRARRGGGG